MDEQVTCDECGASLTVPYSWAREKPVGASQYSAQPPLCKPCWDKLFEAKYGHPYTPSTESTV